MLLALLVIGFIKTEYKIFSADNRYYCHNGCHDSRGDERKVLRMGVKYALQES